LTGTLMASQVGRNPARHPSEPSGLAWLASLRGGESRYSSRLGWPRAIDPRPVSAAPQNIKLIERTKAPRQAAANRLATLVRFARFGRDRWRAKSDEASGEMYWRRSLRSTAERPLR
jgi:hypothetical protein